MRESVNRDGAASRCDFCRLPIPDDPITVTHDGTEYTFCCVACRRALENSERVFTEYRGHRWYRPGVAAVRAGLPQGIPRNSFLLLSAQPGTREAELQTEVVWRALERGETAVVVSFQEPPISIVEQFLTLDWNVLPHLESGRLHVLDCFTYRVEDRERMFDRMNEWNQHLYHVAEPEVTAVRDPSNVGELENKLDACLDAKGMTDEGVVLVDSLTEFGSLVQPVQAYDFVKDIRADVCKGRFVPVFAGATYAGDAEQFPHDLEYMVDGIVDLTLDSSLVEDTLIKRLRVRKMNGALNIPEWRSYEYTSDDGLVIFDPLEEMGGGGAAESRETGEEDGQ